MRHLESTLQQTCVRWARYQYPILRTLLFAVPNGYKTTVTQARIAKAEGLVSGVADLILAHPSDDGQYACLFIEMKQGKGKQSENQKKFQEEIMKFGIYDYRVVRSFEEFKRLIEFWMGGYPKWSKVLLETK